MGNTQSSNDIWLPEPAIRDHSPKNRDEQMISWLTRSSHPKATECRRFLNENLSMLPVGMQLSIRSAAKHRWESALFELITARILQELGAKIEVERPNRERRRPDFTAKFPDQTIVVEAVSPVFNADAVRTMSDRHPLLRIVESNIPPGWGVGVWEMPRIGPNDSRREFERAVREMLCIPPPVDGDGDTELSVEIPAGVIRLHLRPLKRGSRRVMWEAPIVAFDDSESRIRFAVKRKRSQVRSSNEPVVLAIAASGISSDVGDFDKALFGRTYEFYNEECQLEERGFRADGVFSVRGSKQPTYAGVLALLNPGFLGGPPPVLYRHPRFKGRLPRSILGLAQRKYDKDSNEIQAIPTAIPDVMQRLNFVQV